MRADISGSKTPEEIKDLWQTPEPLFDRLNDEFNFEIDIAASKDNHLCEYYIGEHVDSLSIDWPSNMKWCNPPYSNIMPWVEKASEFRNTVMLVPADVSTKWFKKALETCDEVRFIVGGRVSFVRADTKEVIKGNPKGSVLLIWKEKKQLVTVTTYMEI